MKYLFSSDLNYLILANFSVKRKLNYVFHNFVLKRQKTHPPYTKDLQSENIDDLILMLPQSSSFALINKNEDIYSF